MSNAAGANRKRRCNQERVPDLLFRDTIAALTRGVLRGFDFLAALAAENADEPADRVLLPACASTISASVTPLARFIIAITSAFLLVRADAHVFAGGLAWFQRNLRCGDNIAQRKL